MSIEGKWVKIREPSMPSHSNELCGKVFRSFQEIFWVRNHSKPAPTSSCGSAPE